MRFLFKALTLGVTLGLSLPNPALALPIGFGINQGDLEYQETRNDHFFVYHDRRTPEEGAMVLESLERVRPIMEQWFGERRRSPLPVIMSAVTDNASFANIVTDAIELQTMGQGDKALTWHEYTHSTMYRAFDNIFGPPGNLLHVLWMPAWYLEGLAEALSVSLGSDVTAGIERFQALTSTWPSYDRLHSLYGKAGFFERGYATSGAMVSYLMRRGNPDQLPEFLGSFRAYTMPWWWPWTVVPFNGFLPMDAAIKDHTGLSGGPEFYERYKGDASKHWQQRSGELPFLYKAAGTRRAFSSLSGLRSNGLKLLHIMRDNDVLQEVEVIFDQQTGWANDVKTVRVLDDAMNSLARVVNDDLLAYADYEPHQNPGTPQFDLVLQWPKLNKNQSPRGDKTQASNKPRLTRPLRLTRQGSLLGVYASTKHVIWLEQAQSRTQLCYTERAALKKTRKPEVHCPIASRLPERLSIAGEQLKTGNAGEHGLLQTLWLVKEQETLVGSRYELFAVDAASLAPAAPIFRGSTRPVAVAASEQSLWLLLAERDERTLRQLSASGQCLGMLRFQDHLLDVQSIGADVIVGVYGGDERLVKKLKATERKLQPCTEPLPHASPLLHAVQHSPSGKPIRLAQAFAAADLWRAAAKVPPASAASTAQDQGAAPQLATAPLLGEAQDIGKVAPAGEAAWRGRPVLLFPWIGAEDAMGTQYGVVSVPLMDHLQNETVRATFLYGPDSRYPYSEVSLNSTRFEPTLDFAVYRQQTYNGRYYRRSTGTYINGYLDEKGTRLSAALAQRLLGGQAVTSVGSKFAHLKPYIGPHAGIKRGYLIEPNASLSLVHLFGSWTLSNALSGRVALPLISDDFDYNQLGLTTALSRGLWANSRLTLGLEGSRTRGRERRELMEVYRPLKTFIPGSGGGYNQNSFPLAGEAGGGLFSPLFGDTQGRAKASWTMPLVADVDYLLWILYLERLDFTAFYNYGGAWSGDTPRRGFDKLVRAHGYNIDLAMENKGVRFNLGLGTGQVLGKAFEVYVTSGFDALF